MYHLAPKDINNLALVSSRFADIIQDDRFWKDYLKTRYDINIYPDRLSAREVAFKIDKIIALMFDHNIYPTFRLISEIARYMTILDHYDEYMENPEEYCEFDDYDEYSVASNIVLASPARTRTRCVAEYDPFYDSLIKAIDDYKVTN